MRTVTLTPEKIQLIATRLQALKKSSEGEWHADKIVDILSHNKLIDEVIMLVQTFSGKLFTFSDSVFRANPIDAYGQILMQQERRADDNGNVIKKVFAAQRLQRISCYRIALTGYSSNSYELQKSITPLVLFAQKTLASEVMLELQNDLFHAIFSKMKETDIRFLFVNDVLLEALLETVVVEKIRYRADVVVTLEQLKDDKSSNAVLDALIKKVQECDGSLSAICQLIDGVTKDRPGFFFDWRPDIGYGVLYKNLKSLQTNVARAASLDDWQALPKSAIEVQCDCFGQRQ